jgi:hypothetical protein
MRPSTYTASALAALAATAGVATADIPDPAKQPTAQSAAVRLMVQPGETARWQSPRIGAVKRLYVRANGRSVSYNVVPRTNNCVAYIYGEGLAVRVTDCKLGRRVPYVRVRAVSASLRPSALLLRLNY